MQEWYRDMVAWIGDLQGCGMGEWYRDISVYMGACGYIGILFDDVILHYLFPLPLYTPSLSFHILSTPTLCLFPPFLPHSSPDPSSYHSLARVSTLLTCARKVQTTVLPLHLGRRGCLSCAMLPWDRPMIFLLQTTRLMSCRGGSTVREDWAKWHQILPSRRPCMRGEGGGGEEGTGKEGEGGGREGR